ncbi:MAG: glycosyltransferase family 4 protein [Chloroflexota bacterium]
MKILYSLPHPSHRLDTEGAGHTVRANAMLAALESLGAEIVTDQAAGEGSQTAATTYRQLVKKMIPRPVALRIRDRARVSFGKSYGERLTEAVKQHQPDVILQTHIAFSLSGQIASSATGVPLVLDDVAPSWEEKQQYGVGNQQAAEDTHKAITGQAKLCVAVSEPMRRFLEEDGIAPEKLLKVPNGINADIFNANVDGSAIRAEYGFADDTIVIVFVGSFQPYHRVDLLLHAFQQLETAQDVRLLLVGEGRQRQEAVDLAEKIGVADKTVFTGYVDYHDVPRYASAGDIAIMPATNTYGNPMKVYEYMALGKAVLAPDYETITEIGTHGEDLMTFETEKIASIEQTLATVIEDADLRQRLGTAAAQTIASEHTWEKRGETLLGAIEGIL